MKLNKEQYNEAEISTVFNVSFSLQAGSLELEIKAQSTDKKFQLQVHLSQFFYINKIGIEQLGEYTKKPH